MLFENVPVECSNLVCVKLVKFNIFIVAAYRPPSNTTSENCALSSFILDFSVGKEIILLGDFNLPSIIWSDGLPYFDGSDSLTRMFVDSFISAGLYQWVNSPTFVSLGNTLDLALTSLPDCVGDCKALPPFPHCGHSPIALSYIFDFSMDGNGASNYRRAWWKGKYNRIESELSQVDWDLEFQYLSLSNMYERLQSGWNLMFERKENPKS